MFKQIVLIILVLCAFGNQSAMAAAAGAGREESASGAKPVLAEPSRADFKTDNPLLFQIGNLRMIGTIHSMPITIFNPSVRSFLDTMRTHKHLIEHNSEGSEDFFEKIGGLAVTEAGSIRPHLEKVKSSLPEYMQSSFDKILTICPPETIKPWAAVMLSFFTSQKMDDLYTDGMDDVLDAMPNQLPLETLGDMFVAMGLPAMTIDNLIGIFAAEDKHEDAAEEHKHSAYLSGNLSALEKEMDASDYPDSETDFCFKGRKPRNINFARNTLKYLAEGAKDEIFFISMGINHLLGEYGCLNLMSALLGKPLLRFDDKTGEFVPGETYLDSFVAGREALLADLKTKGIEPLVA